MIVEKDFNTYLVMRFMADNPQYLDDDYPDVSDDWIAEMEADELIEYADAYADTIRRKHEQDEQHSATS